MSYYWDFCVWVEGTLVWEKNSHRKKSKSKFQIWQNHRHVKKRENVTRNKLSAMGRISRRSWAAQKSVNVRGHFLIDEKWGYSPMCNRRRIELFCDDLTLFGFCTSKNSHCWR